MPRYRRPRKSGPMVRVEVPIMTNDGAGYHTENAVNGYSTHAGSVWAAVKPSWSKYWAIVHADTGYVVRRAILTADSAKVVAARMEKLWPGATWDTYLSSNQQIRTDLYYERREDGE